MSLANTILLDAISDKSVSNDTVSDKTVCGNTADVNLLRSQFPLLCPRDNEPELNYFDYAATAPMPHHVLDAMSHYETHTRSNVHRASHRLAESATQAYWQARQQVARYLNAPKIEEVVFTSGATAAINMVAYGLEPRLQPGDEIIVSIAEHHSNLLPWQRLEKRCGIKLRWITLTPEGRIDLNHFKQLLNQRTRLVAITHASNVTGAVTDLKAITDQTSGTGILVFTDGAQMAAHGPIDVQKLGVDFYAFSGHKCFGPTGVGVLWGREQCLELLQPLIVGGGMVEWVTPQHSKFVEGYQRFEAGTPPIAQAIGLGAALHWLMSLPWPAIRRHEEALSQQALAMFRSIAGIRLIGTEQTAGRLPLFSFTIDKYHPHDLCYLLDQQGLALRGGQHCAQPLLEYFDLGAACRASMSFLTQPSEITALEEGLNRAMEKLA